MHITLQLDDKARRPRILRLCYFYAYLNETGRAGSVMASSATDSQGSDKDIIG